MSKTLSYPDENRDLYFTKLDTTIRRWYYISSWTVLVIGGLIIFIDFFIPDIETEASFSIRFFGEVFIVSLLHMATIILVASPFLLQVNRLESLYRDKKELSIWESWSGWLILFLPLVVSVPLAVFGSGYYSWLGKIVIGITISLFLVNFLLFLIQSLVVWNKRRIYEIKKNVFNETPEGIIQGNISKMANKIKALSIKTGILSEKNETGRKLVRELNTILKNPELFENQRKKHLARKENLHRSIKVNEMLIGFYKKAGERFQQEKVNYELEQKALKADRFLAESRASNLIESQNIDASSLEIEFMNSFQKLEAEMPEYDLNEISMEEELILEEKIKMFSQEYFT
ncbi:hypothetical protein AB832_07120 [Flavobacteriaceae bacterium (ex Bugula neritina AB1)]|nr:hypothetical protein AB832_07120 [Flavobacteriaceae bacterium (ex Bugula neritina AB1)]